MKVKGVLFLFFLFLGTNQLSAQDPANYVLGEQQLSNTDVYTILLSQNKKLIIGTNQGVFVYGYNSFKPLQVDPKIKGNSFFNLSENSKGEVFCNTIYGSVCKVIKDSLVLYCQVSKEHLSPSVAITFNKKDVLLFSSKSLLLIEEDKAVIVNNSPLAIGTTLFTHHDKTILGSTDQVDSMYELSSDHLSKVGIKIKGRKETGEKTNLFFYELINLDGKLINPLIKSFGVELGYSSKVSKERHESYSCSNDGKALWGRSQKEGIRRIYFKGKELVADAPIFKNTFISFVHQAKDGTLFLGTFGQGIWVVPNLISLQYSINNNQGILQRIVAVKDGVFAVTNKKECYKLSSSKLKLMDKDNPLRFLAVKYPHQPLDKQNSKFIEFYFEYFLKEYKLQTIKSFWYHNSNYYFATTKGIFSTGTFTDENTHWGAPKNRSPSNLSRIFKKYDQLNQRINSICFANNCLYAGTESSLYKIDKAGNKQELFLDGKSIVSNYLTVVNGFLYCATEHFGLLKVEGKNVSVLKNIPIQSYLKITSFHDQLIFQSKKGKLFLYNLEKSTMHFLGINEGVYGYVNDFDVYENKLSYIYDSKSIGQTELRNISDNSFNFNIEVDSFLVNESKTTINSLANLKYHQNRIQVFTQVNDLNLRQNAIITYRLKELDEQWYELSKEDNVIDFKSLVPGNYTLEIKGLYGNVSSNLIKIPISISAPFWKTLWFYVILILFILGIALLLFTIRINRIKKAAKQKLEKQKLMTDLVDSQLTALRSQMNPHFIFNSLNSIQDLILKEETEASYDYIVLFADLVRDTLNYSKMGFIPVEKELSFLETYLKLEKLRFGEQFVYSITNDTPEEIKVPSLIIQPFIENALLHGLLHQDGLKKLDISFHYSNNLICKVRDNGIGRKRSEEIKERQGGAHQSFALKAIEKRLSILETQYGFDIGFTIHDLYENQIPSGTEVVIKMPFKSSY